MIGRRGFLAGCLAVLAAPLAVFRPKPNPWIKVKEDLDCYIAGPRCVGWHTWIGTYRNFSEKEAVDKIMEALDGCEFEPPKPVMLLGKPIQFLES
jgi:hypothetical protein